MSRIPRRAIIEKNRQKELETVLIEEKGKLMSANDNYEIKMSLELISDVIGFYEKSAESNKELRELEETVKMALLFDETRQSVCDKISKVLLKFGH